MKSASFPGRTQRPSSPSLPRRVAAFTLVELLVVIGIIAVLISILLPSLNKAREAANIATCMSNMRSIGQSIDLYVANHKGVMPLILERSISSAFNRTTQGIPAGLTPATEGYTGNDIGTGRTWAGLIKDFAKVPLNVFRCPSDSRFHTPSPQGFLIDPGSTGIDDPRYSFSYTAPYVGHVLGPSATGKDSTGATVPLGRRRLPWSITHLQPPPTSPTATNGGDWFDSRGPLPKGKIRRSAEMVQLMEGYTPYISTQGGWWPDESSNSSGLRGTIYQQVYGLTSNFNVAVNVFRHTNFRKDRTKGPNVLFADGHVEARVDILKMREDSFSSRY